MTDILYKEECYSIQGAIFEVYREMGCGFLENVFQECLEKEFRYREIPFQSQRGMQIFFKGEPLEQTYKADFFCFDKIVLEIKAVKNLLPEHRAQVHNYLKASKARLGILANFGHFPQVEIERIIL